MPLIRQIIFKAGERPGSAPLLLTPGNVVILVGPNNSGKSLALREIEKLSSEANPQTMVVGQVEFPIPTDDEIEALVSKFKSDPPATLTVAPGHIYISQHTFNSDQAERAMQVDMQRITSTAANSPSKRLSLLKAWVYSFYTIRLDGRTRFGLTDPKNSGDLLGRPQNHLWALFKDDLARSKVRELTEKAFGLHFTIDPTGMTKFRIRMNDSKPPSEQIEQGLDEASRAFHRKGKLISDLSDGVQAFVGLVSAVHSLEHKVILIDEPEAFLHPPLARRLGADLSRIAKERDALLIVSTHSAPFVMGCIEAHDAVNIARVTFEKDSATARKVDPEEIKTLFKSSLLRSANVVQGLFHRALVVCESDTDRAFYDEINRRLVDEGRGIGDAHFVNAQNKQTAHRIVGPMRKLGIPAAALIDLDFLNCNGTEWNNLLVACGIPQGINDQLKPERDYLKAKFLAIPRSTADPDPMKRGGILKLDPQDQTRLTLLLDRLNEYGLFLVPTGELESCLTELAVPGKGTEWLVTMLGSLGDSEDQTGYVKPAAGDVWQLIDKISEWVSNQTRLGV